MYAERAPMVGGMQLKDSGCAAQPKGRGERCLWVSAPFLSCPREGRNHSKWLVLLRRGTVAETRSGSLGRLWR